jgi:outer membrane receptor protein involved in Fe transport
MKARRIATALLVFALTALSVLRLSAQAGDQGSLEGVVTDPSGAVIPGVILRATDPRRSILFTTTTNHEGVFRFPVLPVGSYTLAAESPGFAPWLVRDIEVTVGAQVSLRVDLRLPSVTQSVTVEVSPVEPTRSQVSFTISQRSVSNLPTNGRNFLDFALLLPGVTPGSRGFDVSFGGQRKMNLLRVDGADNDNTFFTEALGLSSGFAPYQFSLDTVQEFQVNTNSYSAEFGRAGAGVINVVTRSGTNDFHGSAFWYYRDRSLNGNDFVSKLNSLPKPPYHFNQFGGALGGPLVRNRLFFFLAYDGQRSALQNLVRLNLPAGFSLSANPGIAAFQQLALDYLTPRASSWNQTFDQDVVFARTDWRINNTHLFSLRWNRQRFTGENLENSGQQISLENTGLSLSSTDTVAASLSSSLSSYLANTLLFAYVRSREPGFANSPNPEARIFEAGQFAVIIGRRSGSPRENDMDRFQWSDTLSVVRGRHAFKFGGDILANRIQFFTAGNFSGSFRFNSLESFGRSLAAAPAASPDQRTFIQAFADNATPGVTVHPDFVDYAGFVVDEWRLHPRLTLNVGLRYDLQVIRNPVVRNPSPALAAAGLDTSQLRTDTNNFAPRVGLAWSALGRDRLVIRAGYGLFYARTPSIITSRSYFQNGFTVQTRNFSGGTPDAVLIPSYPNSLCGPPDPSGLPPHCLAPAAGAGNPLLEFFSQDYVQPYTQQGSVGLELQLTGNWFLSASYLGVKGTHLQRTSDVNLGTPETPESVGIALTTTLLSYSKFTLPRPVVGFSRILLFESSANSSYHALALQLNKRFSHGRQFSAAYTLSKTIDDNPEPIAVIPPGTDNLLLYDPSNPRADRGPGVNDQRHRLVMYGLWQIDVAKTHSRLARRLLSGWELSGIFTAQSGLPYSGLVSFDLNDDGNSSNERTPGLGRNTFVVPASVSLQARLTRNVQLTERAKLQLSWDSFNLFNHANITAVRTTQFAISSSAVECGIASIPCLVPQTAGLNAFGTPVATSGSRIMQLSAKFLF